MNPEEMDVIELVEDVRVEPSWRVKEGAGPDVLRKGARGMVIHREGDGMPVYDVEFVDAATQEPCVLAKLRGSQVQVVERYTLGLE